MNDILISAKRLKKELITLLICFIIAFATNVGAIIYYKSDAIEMLSSLPYVLVFAVFIYIVWSFLRLIKRGLFKIKNSK